MSEWRRGVRQEQVNGVMWVELVVNARRYEATYLARMPDSGTATKNQRTSKESRGQDGWPARVEVSLTSFHSDSKSCVIGTEQLKGLPRRPAGKRIIIILEYRVRGH